MARYFDDSTVVTGTCRRCGQAGHVARNCTQDYLSVSKCLLCAQTGHLVSDCPQRIRPSSSSSAAAASGGSRGSHYSKGERVSSDNEDGAVCIVCGELDHVNCSFEVDPDILVEDTCPKCAETGHDERTCPTRQSFPRFQSSSSRNPSGRHSWGGQPSRDDPAAAKFTPRGGRVGYRGTPDRFFEKPKKRTVPGRLSSSSAGSRPKRQRMWSGR